MRRIYRQMEESDLGNAAMLREIAKLIYETDPYIYPALFGSEAIACILLPQMIQKQDTMFCLENLFLCMEGSKTLGLILWHRGPLTWEPKTLFQTAQEEDVVLPETVKKVVAEYFSSYLKVPDNVLSVINVCVAEAQRGKGIGSMMVKSFCERNAQSKVELYVLADNPTAIKCYKSNGFSIAEELNGFSVTSTKPWCYRMEKDI